MVYLPSFVVVKLKMTLLSWTIVIRENYISFRMFLLEFVNNVGKNILLGKYRKK